MDLTFRVLSTQVIVLSNLWSQNLVVFVEIVVGFHTHTHLHTFYVYFIRNNGVSHVQKIKQTVSIKALGMYMT